MDDGVKKSTALVSIKTNAFDPLDAEVAPGIKVRDLKTLEDCLAATLNVEQERETIMAQIASEEANPGFRPAGWRTRAETALRWKRRILKAINSHRDSLPKKPPGPRAAAVKERRQIILEIIQEDIGDEAMERYARIARHRHPEAFGLAEIEGEQS